MLQNIVFINVIELIIFLDHCLTLVRSRFNLKIFKSFHFPVLNDLGFKTMVIINNITLFFLSVLLFKRFLLFRIFIFYFFKNISTFLCLSRNKTKRQSDKNTTLTPTKSLPKKYGHSLVNFQNFFFTYKLDSQIKNYIYK